MKYYKFEYKNKLQKILWNLNILGSGIMYAMIGFALTLAFNNLLSTFLGTLFLFISCLVGFVISLYNFCKKKGVFLFDSCIEISSIYTKKTTILISEITKIKVIEKYGIVGKGDTGFKGGDRTDVFEIYFNNIGRVAFKIKNQDKFLIELTEKLPSTVQITKC